MENKLILLLLPIIWVIPMFWIYFYKNHPQRARKTEDTARYISFTGALFMTQKQWKFMWIGTTFFWEVFLTLLIIAYAFDKAN